MFYDYSIAIPANTTKANSVIEICKMTYGIIKHVAIAFPPGPKGLAHLTVYRFEHQVWPSNPDGDFAWDNFTIEFNEEFDLTEKPHVLTLRGWNDDDTYPHTITVRFELGGKEWGLSDLLSIQTPMSRLEDWES